MTLGIARRYAVLAVLVLAAILSLHAAAFAANPFGVGTPDSRGVVPTGPLGSFFMWIAMWQTTFYRQLTGALGALKQSGHAFWLLGGVSFLYGIFHAVGPGHGKAVITSYLLVSRQTVRRGILISFAAALVQGVTAIAIVLIAAVALKMTSIAMTKATDGFEIASYALVTLVGAWLLWAKLSGHDLHAHGHSHAAGGAPHAHCGHDHHHGDGHGHHGHAHHDHGDEHDHSHAPDPQFLAAGPLTMSRAWTAILAVGIRPCSGAIIILVFALSQHLLYAGVASVVAMSIGTAMTVSLLVVLAVSAKGLALRLAGADSKIAGRVVHILEIGAAFAVLLFGLTLLGGATVGSGML